MIYPFKTGIVALKDSGKVNYIDEGQGNQTLVFIHGLANYALGWKKNISELKNNFRCIAIDLPGNGLSEAGRSKYSIDYFSHVVAELIQQLKLENVVLVGHSMGGQIAINTLFLYPNIAQKLILCAPAGFEVFTSWEATMYHTSINMFDYFASEESSLRNSIKSSFSHYNHQADDMIDDLIKLLDAYPYKEYRKMVDDCIYSMLNHPVFNKLHKIKQPTLILFGDRDALIPNRVLHPVTTKKIAEDGASQIPNSTLQMIHQCGHFLQWEKAGVVNRAIKEFLQ